MRKTVRIIALLSIFVSLFLNSLAEIPEGRNDTPEVPATDIKEESHVTPLDYSIVSLFAQTRPRITRKAVVKQRAIPDLAYIGIVATKQRQIYSFKDSSTGKLVLLEKGIETDGLTFMEDADSMCTLKIAGRLFKVEKK